MSNFVLVTLARSWRTCAVFFAILAILGMLIAFFFIRSNALMEHQLRERLQSAAAAAAVQFDGAQLEQIQSAKDVETPLYHLLSQRLRNLRDAVPGLRFAYILRQTEDPMTLEFVADADSFLQISELDENGNGRVDPDEAPAVPGDRYDISSIPTLQDKAFLGPITDSETTYDQWGALVSGYAPIRRWDDGRVVAVLGVDMEAEEFLAQAQGVIPPIVLLLLVVGIGFVGGAITIAILRHQIAQAIKLRDERAGLLQLTFHQLGEPMTIFKWSLETLKDRRPGESLEKLMPEHFSNMEDGIQRMSHVVDALREAEQIEHGTLRYEAARASMSELLQTVMKDQQAFVHHRNQTIELLCENKLWCMMDAKWITDVLHSLIHNAMHFSPEGATITVKAAYKKKMVLVQVIDRGAGVPKKDLEKLFTKFARASNATVHHPYGTGLSLYRAKGIVEKGGGKMWIESIEGKGTIVRFTLPVA